MADRALLCGVNDYQSISPLRGCINDVRNLRRLLTETYGFDSGGVRILTDEEVVRSAIVDGFRWLADGASASDRLVFFFAGHGSYTDSDNDDEDVDELLCLYDMDWSRPQSYLVDDDLGDLTRTVQTGRLTVVLDCCHSGSGTRAITRERNVARRARPTSQLVIVADTAAQHVTDGDTERALDEDVRSVMRVVREEDRPPVLARFVEPPQEYRSSRSGVRRNCLGRSVGESLNHQLLAGAKDNQTAADAFIDGQYNGAFSYYLCNSARSDASRSYSEIMRETVDAVRSHGFGQTPQIEGPFGAERIFGSGNSDPAVSQCGSDESSDSLSISGHTGVADLTAAGRTSGKLAVFSDFLRVSEKLIDLAGGSTDVAAEIIPEASAESQRGTGTEAVVYVHGISRHPPGYSGKWFNAMRPHLSRNVERYEVRWSDIVNSRSETVSRAEVRDVQQRIEREIERRAEAIEDHIGEEGRQVRLERPRGSGFSIDDFSRYMVSRTTREAILSEFDVVVRPLLAAGRRIHVIAHSWGTVVAFEGLRRMDSQQLPGRVENLFVAGSALSISPVRFNLFDRISNGRRPKHVEKVINLNAAGDLVGGQIGEHFSVHREFLSLYPTDCSTYFFSNVAMNPACAHSSYFSPNNLEVNRNIFARAIN